MHDLNTIVRLNRQAHERSISTWRNQGKYVVAAYDGMHLVVAEPHDSADSAISAGARITVPGLSISLLPPIPPEQRVGHRDQSEDRGVSFASIDDYLRHTGQLK